MKTISGFHFPETQDELAQWKPTIRYKALDREVLVVAKTRVEGGWSAYIGAVTGECHDAEYESVLRFGTKLDGKVAAVLFPMFGDLPYCK